MEIFLVFIIVILIVIIYRMYSMIYDCIFKQALERKLQPTDNFLKDKEINYANRFRIKPSEIFASMFKGGYEIGPNGESITV